MLLAAGIPMLIGYFIMLQMFNITYRRSLNQEAETILNAVAGSFDSAFSNIYDGIRQLAGEEIIRKNLENGDGAGTSVLYGMPDCMRGRKELSFSELLWQSVQKREKSQDIL